MRAYRTIWSSVAGLVVLAGATLALATTPPFVSLLLFLTIGTCAGVLRNLRLLENAAPPPSRAALLKVATDVVVAGSAGLACYGFGGTTGLELPAVMVGLTLTSPPAIMLIRRLLGSSPAEPGVTERWTWIGSELAGWSDTELYSVWCATDNEVLRTTQSHQAATAVRARQHLLSEIERRHPAKTSVWLASDSALKGAPPRFLISADGS
jgi:hypothetical protein